MISFPAPNPPFPDVTTWQAPCCGAALHFCQSRDLLLESESTSADPAVKIGVPHLQESSDMLILGTKLPLLLQSVKKKCSKWEDQDDLSAQD